MTSDFSLFLNHLYASTYIPMHHFKGNDIIEVFPNWAFMIDDMMIYKNATIQDRITFHYFVTEENLYIGIIRNKEIDEGVILGPISSVPLTADIIAGIATTYSNGEKNQTTIEEFFERTPVFSLNRFLHIMSLINKELNGELIDVIKKYENINSDIEESVNKSHSNSLMKRKEHEAYHNTYYFEQEYYSYVEKGDVAGLDSFLRTIPSITEGTVAPSLIRQAKNIFISSITLTTRKAIAGGLDIETAYELSDHYIQEVEKMSDSASITLLNNNAVFDFTRRVADAKIPQGMSQEIFNCIQYISNHVNQNISVKDIADTLNMDRSTLSKKFKRELSFNISDFIMRRKLEEAKSLLTYTDNTVSEISEYLCFSSQAYFQNVFKKKYGMTPREFRRK
ncbi:AraC family transcriptional regulator [Lachnospiraceae bacterium OttesenSCG-928-D06]|nr:AraC family transcriptional regulator [Lachnospiraceae bacterium OttesenSCG-928-D06]